MDPDYGISAAEWLQAVDEHELARVIRKLGEERFAKRVARAIMQKQQEQPLTTTRALAEVVAAAVPTRELGQHPATRTFQALRLQVNHELDELSAALPQAMHCLGLGGRLVVISFHSLEDRIVKRFIREASRGDPYPADLPVRASELRPSLRAIGRAMRASKTEIERNPRARSAVMRVAEKMEPSSQAAT
jgi:16S rRNA (cytosine1402-N4)-methyltransferase